MIPRSLLPSTVALFLLIASPAQAVIWAPDLRASLDLACGQQKLVLLHLRAGCLDCNEDADAFVARSEQHELFQRLYASFVLVRVDAFLDNADVALQSVISQQPEPPALLVIDPSGEVVFSWRDFTKPEDLQRFATTLVEVKREAPLLVAASELRIIGHLAESDFIIGKASMDLGAFPEAYRRFARAATMFRDSKRVAETQEAEAYAAFVTNIDRSLSETTRTIARNGVEHIARTAVNPEVAATAWYLLAGIHHIEGKRTRAIELYRYAYSLAAPGSRVARQARAELATLDKRPLREKLPSALPMRIVKPGAASLMGKTEFHLESRPDVEHVEYFLDNVPVARSSRRPFEARIDLGPVPLSRDLKAVGYNRVGVAVAEAVTTLNDRSESFRVRIVSPAGDPPAGEAVVEATADVPPGRVLKGLELYWKEERIASFVQPPFRTTFRLPDDFGYLRASARLDDGSTAEDTRIVHGPGMTDVVDVKGVSFSATVVDEAGSRVAGLASKDFAVKEDGQPVAVTAREAEDAPVTIGVAIDTSASMRSVLLSYTEMVARLLDAAVDPRTKIFLVSFDSSPSLMQPATADTRLLRNKVFAIEPGGGTALYDGVIFALQQFQGLAGKKGLIVVSDGLEQYSRAAAQTATRLAQTMGVPIYGLVPIQKNRRGAAIDDLAAASGGIIFYQPPVEQQPADFARICAEIRGQYLLSFVSSLHKAPDQWTKLTIEVPARKAKVRTITGYYVR